MIDVESVGKSFDENAPYALRDITFSAGKGDSIAIIGPSGCGKTTLLYILAGLIKPTSGQVRIRGKQILCPLRTTAFMLQDFGLLPWKTVRQNVCLGMKIHEIPKEEQDNIAGKLLLDLGLSPHSDSYPALLSGGEKQRVAIARALALRPEIMLMDEPFSSLDTITREKLQDTLLDICRERELTMIIVTHSIEEAVFLGRTILVMGPRPGTVKVVINNANAGDLSYRSQREFFSTCTHVRQAIEL